MTTPDDGQAESINAVLSDWRQGDCVLEGEHWFVLLTEDADPETSSKPDAGGPSSCLVEDKVIGFVILTQSCDVVRRHQERRFVAVAPLVEVDVEDLELIEGGYRPQYAWIPGVADRNLVADLDRIMTVNKSAVAKWKRVQGCASDEEARTFARAIARKIARFAFPDDFMPVVKKLQERLREKHGRASPEGEALRNVKEIRVRAAPSWTAESVELMFWFICYDEIRVAQIRKDSHLERWLALLQVSGRYKSPPLGTIVTLEDLTGKDYVESDPLDLDHLSRP